MATVLEIAQTCASRLQLTAPTSFIGSTDNNMILLKAMINRAITEIQNGFPWPELQQEYKFRLDAGVDAYPLATDTDRIEFETLWNRNQHWPLIGPIDPVMWQQYKSGLITTLPRQRFRVKGWANEKFYIDPRPTTNEQAQYCIMEYISINRYKPRAWTANTAILLNAYYSSNGKIYKCTTAGTTSTLAPSFSNNSATAQTGIGYDNTVEWTYTPAWTTNTVYRVGDYVYVTATKRMYQCSTDGTSGAVAPSVTSGSETDGTVVWDYFTTAIAPVVGTEYSTSDAVFVSTRGYRCSVAGISGNSTTLPYQFTDTTMTDGTAVWTWQSSYQDMVADTDSPIIDSRMVTDGAVWRFKEERGLDFEDLRATAEAQIEISKSKLVSAGVVTVNGWRLDTPMIGPWSYPIANFQVY